MTEHADLPSEAGAHPAAAAIEWLNSVVIKLDLLAAWPLTDPLLRRALVRGWLASNREWLAENDESLQLQGRDLEELAEVLEGGGGAEVLWEHFAAPVLDSLRATYGQFSITGWGLATAPRPVAPGLELVVFVLMSGSGSGPGPVVLEHAEVPAYRVLMRHTEEGWLVAGFSEEPPGEVAL